MKNHPKHRHHWQRYVNELMGRGEYGLKSPSLVLKYQAELAKAAREADKAADIYMKANMDTKAVMWRNWSMQLRAWLKQLNSTFTHS